MFIKFMKYNINFKLYFEINLKMLFQNNVR